MWTKKHTDQTVCGQQNTDKTVDNKALTVLCGQQNTYKTMDNKTLTRFCVDNKTH